LYWTTNQSFGTVVSDLWLNTINDKLPVGYEKRYDELLNYLQQQRRYANTGIMRKAGDRLMATAPAMEAGAAAVEEVAIAGYGEQKEMAQDSAGNPSPPAPGETIPVRTNLQETAFFFPQLQTDADGNVTFKFTMP